MKRNEDKINKLSVRLLKGNFDDLYNYKDFLKEEYQNLIPSINNKNMIGILLKDVSKTPNWVKYLLLNDNNIKNKINSFLLLVFENKRIFAYSFGYGYIMIKNDIVESDFGLNVTLNCIDPEKIKSINTYSLANNSKQKFESSAKLSSIYNFEYDNLIDMVQKLQGQIKDEYKCFFENLNGSESLSINTRIKFDKLNNLSKTLLDRFNSTDFLKIDLLKDINNIKCEKDNKEIEVLNEKLKEEIKKENIELFVADYEILQMDETFYSYYFLGKDYFNLDDIVADITINNLNKYINIKKEAEDKYSKSWNLFKCILAEVEYNNKKYFLSKGKWFNIKESFLNEILNSNEKYKTENPLPKYNKKFDNKQKIEFFNKNGTPKEESKEGLYNFETSKERNLILFDKKLVHINKNNPVEICDLYDETNNIFYHIKCGNESSSLSHLWNQGFISEELANSNNENYVKKFKELANSELNPNRKIYYGIITDKNLTIFSEIALYRIIQSLKKIGIKDENIKIFFIGSES